MADPVSSPSNCTICKQNWDAFSANALLAALAPQDVVLAAFLRGQQQDLSSTQARHDAFAGWIQEYFDRQYAPPQRYLMHLVRCYVREHCGSQQPQQDEELTEELAAVYGLLQGSTRPVPNPDECGYCAFAIPAVSFCSFVTLRLCVFPYHRDVSLRLWEAGAFLAEYLIHQCKQSSLGHVVELGAGVGATGLALIAAGVATRVVCTDYTVQALENMRHNLTCNKEWLTEECDEIGVAHLDWNEYGQEGGEREKNDDHTNDDNQHLDCLLSIEKEMQQANLLLAADVAYDRRVLPVLARTVQRFLNSGNNNKRALFATTRRNLETFALLQALLVQKQGLTCRVVTPDALPPMLFPTKFHQPRHEVELWELSLHEKAS